MLTEEEYKYYQRQFKLTEVGLNGQEKLKKAKILVVGAGGLGCPVLSYLAGSGVGSIGIIDYDKVHLSNLHRQVLFGTEDIGKYKAHRAKEILSGKNPNISITSYNERLTEENIDSLFQQFEIIVDCTDNFGTRYLIDDFCRKYKIPFIYGAIFKMEGYVSVFHLYQNNSDKAVSYRDLYPEPPVGMAFPNCEETGVVGTVAGLVGIYQANEVIKIILGKGSTLNGKLLRINAMSLESVLLKIAVNEKEHVQNREHYYVDCPKEVPIKKELSPDELYSLLISLKNIQLIDIRGNYFLPGITEHDIKIPFHELEMNVKKINSDLPVVLFCNKGINSSIALQLLEKRHGLKNVYHLAGGMVAWNKFVEERNSETL